MITYCTNDDLVLDTGKSLNDFFDSSLTSEQIATYKTQARTRAYNYINSRYLDGKTVIPATNIVELKQVEIDLVITNLMQDAFSQNTLNQSDWAEKYKVRATEVLENLKFGATSETPVANSENTGNGTILAITVNDMFTRTEQWLIRLTSYSKFSVHGTVSGYLPAGTVGILYPEKDWGGLIKDYGLNLINKIRFEEFPISFLITAGTIDFVQDDKFTFKTYASSSFVQRNGRLVRG